MLLGSLLLVVESLKGVKDGIEDRLEVELISLHHGLWYEDRMTSFLSEESLYFIQILVNKVL